MAGTIGEEYQRYLQAVEQIPKEMRERGIFRTLADSEYFVIFDKLVAKDRLFEIPIYADGTAEIPLRHQSFLVKQLLLSPKRKRIGIESAGEWLFNLHEDYTSFYHTCISSDLSSVAPVDMAKLAMGFEAVLLNIKNHKRKC